MFFSTSWGKNLAIKLLNAPLCRVFRGFLSGKKKSCCSFKQHISSWRFPHIIMYVCKNRVCRIASDSSLQTRPSLFSCLVQFFSARGDSVNILGAFLQDLVTLLRSGRPVSATTSATRLCCITETGWNTFVMIQGTKYSERKQEVTADLFAHQRWTERS